MSTAWTAHAVRRSYPRLRIPTAPRRRQISFLKKILPSTFHSAPSTNEPSLNDSQEGLKRADALSASAPKPRAINGGPVTPPTTQLTPLEKPSSEPSLQFLKHGLKLSSVSGEQPHRFLDYTFLRDSCSCPKCIDPSTTQKSFQTSDIPLNILAQLSFKNHNEIRLIWSNDVPGYDDTHESSYELESLLRDTRKSSTYFGHATPDLWDAKRLSSATHLWHSFHDIDNPTHLHEILEALTSFGIAFLKDVPQEPRTVGLIAKRLGGVRETFYGDIWDVKSVPKAANVAYTSQFLGFHMDLLYMDEPPRLQLLHCLSNTCKGGESMFSDALKAAYRFQSERPDDFAVLSTFPVSFKYKNGEHDYWRARPTIHPLTFQGKAGIIRHVNWSPPFQGPLPHNNENLRPDGGHDASDALFRRFISASHAFSKELEAEENVFELKLEPGQCVIFDNRRIVHARRSFDEASGERWLQGTYVGRHDYWHTLVTSRQRGEASPIIMTIEESAQTAEDGPITKLKQQQSNKSGLRGEDSPTKVTTGESAHTAEDVPITKFYRRFTKVPVSTKLYGSFSGTAPDHKKPPQHGKNRVASHRESSLIHNRNQELRKEQPSPGSMSDAQNSIKSKLFTHPASRASNYKPLSWSKGPLGAASHRGIFDRTLEPATSSLPPSPSFDSNKIPNGSGAPSQEPEFGTKTAIPIIQSTSRYAPILSGTPRVDFSSARASIVSSPEPGVSGWKQPRTWAVAEEGGNNDQVHDDVGLRDFEQKMLAKLKLKGLVN